MVVIITKLGEQNNVGFSCLEQENIPVLRFSSPFNSSRPSDAIWWQRSGSTLAQVMACCLTAPSHYLNQCWPMISEVLCNSYDTNFTENTSNVYHWNEFKISQIVTAVKSPRGQWVSNVNSLGQNYAYIHQHTGQSLLQIMACHLIGAKRYLNQCWFIVNWNLGIIFQWN